MAAAGTPRAVARTILTVAWALLGAYLLQLATSAGGDAASNLLGRWGYDLVLVAACGVAAWGAARQAPPRRAAWLLVAGALGVWSAGQILYSILWYFADSPPNPSAADALFLAFYGPAYAGLVLLLRARVRGVERIAWLDGLIAGLAIAAIAAAAAVPAVADAIGTSALASAVAIAYPVSDVVLLGTVGAMVALTGGRIDRPTGLVGLGLVLFAVGDLLYLVGGSSVTAFDISTATWPAALLVIAAGPWATPAPAVTIAAIPRAAPPLVAAAAALALLAVSATASVSRIAIGLACAAIAATLVRLRVSLADNRALLASSRHEALTDALTGLRNRRALLADLDETVAAAGSAPWLLALFDLDGFKHYNDTFGHPAGDALLHRLGGRLATAMPPGGQAYRLGGDEFCVLQPAGPATGDGGVAHAAAALRESGEAFTVGCSYGVVRIPDEADDATEALRLADLRMYERKRRRTAAGREGHTVLLRVIQERSPDLGTHLEGVGELAASTARVLGLEPAAIEQTARAAELHDIGKVGVPEAILNKAGPLDADEWAFIHRHTIIGERILSAVPALAPVGHIVRSSHESWDGTGYPDGLAGDAIPVEARVIAVCDAFDAMLADRAYRKGVGPGRALAELRRRTGTQFDPAVVEAFAEAWRLRADRPADRASAGG